MGNRTTRRDTWLRRMSSRIANGVRGSLLRDGTPDTGCGIKVFDRQVFLDMPRFNHMHRFMPALYQREGYSVVSVPVNHRSRMRGQSKYGLHNRLWVGIIDLVAVSATCAVAKENELAALLIAAKPKDGLGIDVRAQRRPAL
jgi:dolichol-phosphate mannosyltransferase